MERARKILKIAICAIVILLLSVVSAIYHIIHKEQTRMSFTGVSAPYDARMSYDGINLEVVTDDDYILYHGDDLVKAIKNVNDIRGKSPMTIDSNNTMLKLPYYGVTVETEGLRFNLHKKKLELLDYEEGTKIIYNLDQDVPEELTSRVVITGVTNYKPRIITFTLLMLTINAVLLGVIYKTIQRKE